ncbi:MAG: formylmethanofuran dehydrogenase subunit E family protein [Candidatus Bathyarchaeia archaeon]
MLCKIPKKLLQNASEFHGHLGIFLVLGLKAGLYANKKMGKNKLRMHAIIETEPAPPFSCFVDGIQMTTGCTMGKQNIELKNGRSLSVQFTKGDAQLKLEVKETLLEQFKKTSSLEENKKAALNIANMPIEEIFEIS